MKKAHARRVVDPDKPKPENYGDELTADTLVSKNKQSLGENPDVFTQKRKLIEEQMAYALVFWDAGTEFNSFAPGR